MPNLQKNLIEKHISTGIIDEEHLSFDYESLQNDDPVFYSCQTGQIFPSYDTYLKQMQLLHLPVWCCNYTGKGGLLFFEAEISESNSCSMLENIPEYWKRPLLEILQYSTDSLSTLSSKMQLYCKKYLSVNEMVKVKVDNDNIHSAIVSEALRKNLSFDDNEDDSEYKLNILSMGSENEIFAEAAVHGQSSIERNHDLKIPTIKILKSFIRSSAIRYGHIGMPWLVNSKLCETYNLHKAPTTTVKNYITSAHFNRVSSLQKKFSSEAQDLMAESDQIYPILDENLNQCNNNVIPAGKDFDLDISVSKLLDVYQFLQSFSSLLSTPHLSFCDLIEALKSTSKTNNVLSSICKVYFSQFMKLYKNGKFKKYFQKFDHSQLNEWKFDELKHHEWYKWVESFLKFMEPHPKFAKLSSEIEFYIFKYPAKVKLDFLVELKCIFVALFPLHQYVDNEIEDSANLKQNLRESEAERKRLVKEEESINNEIAVFEGSRLSKDFRSLDIKSKKINKKLLNLTKKIAHLGNKYFKKSKVRITPLGSDRNHRKYWWMDSHLQNNDVGGSNIIFIELPQIEECSTWKYYDSVEEFEGLKKCLDINGCRESSLFKFLSKLEDRIVSRICSFQPSN